MIGIAFLLLSIAILILNSLTSSQEATPSPSSTEEWMLSDVSEDWEEITPGLELRQLAISEKPALFVRADLRLLNLDLLYDPDEPLTVSDWRTSTEALFVVNAGFFEPDFTTSGILMTQNHVYGESYTQRDNADRLSSGMFLLDNDQASIHLLEDRLLPIAGNIDLGLESFPVLLLDNTPVDFRLPDRTARRTSIALDDQGRVVFIILHDETLTLYEFREGLLQLAEDLSLISALNLDGGLSTGVSILAGGILLEMDSNGEVSSVFAISP